MLKKEVTGVNSWNAKLASIANFVAWSMRIKSADSKKNGHNVRRALVNCKCGFCMIDRERSAPLVWRTGVRK
jgi:hypothetical protein